MTILPISFFFFLSKSSLEFRTVRYLLIVSMIIDFLGAVSWVFSYLQTNERLVLVLATVLAFISSLLTIISCCLFSQAVDTFENSNISLGWPFYLTLATSLFSFCNCITAASLLRNGNNNEEEDFPTQGPISDDLKSSNLLLPKRLSFKDRAASTPEVRKVSFQPV